LNKESDGKDELGFSTWNSLTIREQSASSVFNILNELKYSTTYLVERVIGFGFRIDAEVKLPLIEEKLHVLISL